jgi:hypothetical protein
MQCFSPFQVSEFFNCHSPFSASRGFECYRWLHQRFVPNNPGEIEIGGPHGGIDLYANRKKLRGILAHSPAALWAATRINPESSASELVRL